MGKFLFWLVVAGLVFSLIDCGGGTGQTLYGEVVDRVYVPAHTSYGTDSKGRLTTQHTSDDYTIVVRTWDGIKKVDTDAEGYYSVKLGQRIKYQATKGCMSNALWYPHYNHRLE